MSLTQQLTEHVRACFAGIWIQTDEQEEAVREINQLCREQEWQLATWDIDQGLQGAASHPESTPINDPLSAVRFAEQLATPSGAGLLVLSNFHRFLASPEVAQAVARQVQLGKQRRTFLVILAPTIDLPRELEKLFVVLAHELPGREQLQQIAAEIATEPDELPVEAHLDAVLEAAAGLTRYEAEGAFSLSLVREGRLTPETVWQVKAGQLKKTDLVSLHEGREQLADLGGLESLKAFCLRALRPRFQLDSCMPRGVLLLSPPGCGKSAICKALGNEVGRPTLRLDMGALLGSLVGQSEANIRRAIAIAEAMQPCILMLDEIDKGLSGAGGSGQSDSGVSARLFGTLLTWLADRTSDVFVVATANSIERLPPEFTRAERLDGVFFVDLPDQAEREAIWQIHRGRFEIDDQESRPDDSGWTGAEIHACCRLAKLLDLPLAAAAENIVPIGVSAAESIAALRTWASGRCLSAAAPGIYQPRQRTNNRRAVRTSPSSN